MESDSDSDSAMPPTPNKNKRAQVERSKSTEAHQSSSADQPQPGPSSKSTSLTSTGPFAFPATAAVPSSTSSKMKITRTMKAQVPERIKKKTAAPLKDLFASIGGWTMDQQAIEKGNRVPPKTLFHAPPNSTATATVTSTSSASGISIPLSSPLVNNYNQNQVWSGHHIQPTRLSPRPRNNQSSSMWSPNGVPPYTPRVPPAASPSANSQRRPSSSAGASTSASSNASAGPFVAMLNSFFTNYLSLPPQAPPPATPNQPHPHYFRGTTSSTVFNSTPKMITPPPPVLATPAMPPDWMKCYDDTSLSLDPFQKFSVGPTSLEFQTIVELLAPTQVISAEKVVNPDLWQRYCNTRKEMIRAKTADLSLLSKLGLDEREVIRSSHHTLNYDRDPLLETDAGKYSPNEVLLFHCTRNQQNLDKILRQGLDERLSSVKGGLLGKGIYFSDDPEKSIQYDGGAGVILIFAVLLGDCFYVDCLTNPAQLVREPEKKKAQKRNFNDQFFDSITSRPKIHNEYVIYNRHQCCPLYMVKYQLSHTNFINTGGDNYAMARGAPPPFVWKGLSTGTRAMPNQASDGSWPFYAVSVFEKMGVVPLPGNLDQSQSTPPAMDEDIWYDPEDSDEHADTNDKLAALINLGFFDDVKNRAALNRYDNNLEQAANFLLDSEDQPPPPPTNSGALGQQSNQDEPMTTVDLTNNSSPDSSNGVAQNQNKEMVKETDDVPEEVANWLLYFSNTPPTPPPERVLPALEECSICCNEYNSFSHSPSLWNELKCSHKLCLSCFQSIQTSGTTMSGVRHTSVRCPFCQGTTGIEVGTCPNGKMTVTTNPASCEGYPSCGSIQINYMVSGKYRLSRVAYLPNNPEGNEVLTLLQTAWDRRLCFTIGNSNTTGAQDVLVWNIHHKTSLRGGVQAHGFPDPGYLERAKWELKGYGIE